ncbi:HPr family phosphocarrier protein [Mobilitalea sibirica]|uniref:HPr family phosphocarrier protein n=1 Tax=Mobilitalea sibirica TaxID=1462919 RepID=A0A8J7H346_9FIRM|nr:HPr family phosphocarrier protein [Mobilitalea sibirica]MBH1941160.1 HPr family phosphocarrier protein [Mobilitalea sibirica]
MNNLKIKLNTFDKIKHFVNMAYRLDYDLSLISGNYVVDGKSIMGIFSLDLSKPIEVNFSNNDTVNDYPKELEEFIL